MVKFLSGVELQQLLDEASSSVYIYQRKKELETVPERQWIYEDDGSVIITFTSEIGLVEPNTEDTLGRIWNPKLTDDKGNPLKDRAGNLKGAWVKYEAKGLIKGKEVVYGLGSSKSIPLKALRSESVVNKLDYITGTKWKIVCLDDKKFRWSFDYLGKERLDGNNKKIDIYGKTKDVVLNIRDKNPSRALVGFDKKELIDAVAFQTGFKEKEINGIWQEIIDNKVIREEGDKIFFN